MEKEFNLIEFLKDAPIGTRLYSPICGECELKEITEKEIYVKGEHFDEIFYINGTYYENYGECLLFPSKNNRDWSTFKVEKESLKVGDYVKSKGINDVFKIKKQDEPLVTFMKVLADSLETERIISEAILDRYEKVSKFDPKWLKPFDRVLVRDETTDLWFASLFSHSISEDGEEYPYIICNGLYYKYCIPYNDETKHLVGTTGEEPNFYKFD